MAVGGADVAVVEVQAAGAEDLGGEAELPPPVVDDGPPEEAAPPVVHLGGHLLGHGEEARVPGDGEPEVALVVERHGADLAERVLAVEHPAVGSREQRIRDVAQPALQARPRLGGRPRALDPLPPQVGRDLAALEPPLAGVGDPVKGSFIDGRHSRQDGTTLRQIATRLGGEYHDGNAKLVPTAMLQRLGTLAVDGDARLPGQRELAMALTALGATLLAGLPLLLHFAGSRWNPGPRFQTAKNSPLPFPARSNQPAT